MADNGITIGEAYLQIRPSMEGVAGEIDEAMGSAGSSGASSFGSAFATGIKAVSGVAISAVSVASAGVAKLTSAATASYADYEQLIGGMETLYEDLSWDVEQNAKRAFETAGLSTNEYMETALSFAASLNNSLVASEGNIARSADLTDQIIIDMADNVNKMGTSMESVQNAYRGFSRGNFTMLDNLALGFAGTKEGMEALLAKATELSGVEYDIDSFADIADAIHVVQTDMGITGTTAKEASETISGSLSSVKSAFQNLIAGLANPDADLSALIENVVSTGTTYLENIIPTIMNVLTEIANALPMIVPVITQQFPRLVQGILPPLIEAIIALVQALIEALPDILSMLIEMLPSVMNLVIETILSMLPLIIDLGLQLIMALANGIIDALPTLIPAVIDVVFTIVDKLTDPDMLVQLIDAALTLIVALAEGLIRALPRLIEKAPEIIKNLLEALIKAAPLILEAGAELIFQLIEGVLMVIGELVTLGANLVESVSDGFFEKVENAKQWGKDMIQNFINGIKEKWENLKSTVTDLASTIKSLLGFSEPEAGPLSNFHTYAPDMMNLFAEGIRKNIGVVEGALGTMTSAIQTDFTADYTLSGIASGEVKESSEMAVAGGDWVFPIYIGQERLDTIILNAQQRHNLVSGGR